MLLFGIIKAYISTQWITFSTYWKDKCYLLDKWQSALSTATWPDSTGASRVPSCIKIVPATFYVNMIRLHLLTLLIQIYIIFLFVTWWVLDVCIFLIFTVIVLLLSIQHLECSPKQFNIKENSMKQRMSGYFLH